MISYLKHRRKTGRNNMGKKYYILLFITIFVGWGGSDSFAESVNAKDSINSANSHNRHVAKPAIKGNVTKNTGSIDGTTIRPRLKH